MQLTTRESYSYASKIVPPHRVKEREVRGLSSWDNVLQNLGNPGGAGPLVYSELRFWWELSRLQVKVILYVYCIYLGFTFIFVNSIVSLSVSRGKGP